MTRFFLAPAALIAALALTASAQAAVTSTEISAPARTTHVLYRTDAAHPQTIAVAGVANGPGSVDIVCQVGATVVHVQDGVPVAANGTFAAPDAPLDAVADGADPEYPARSCLLRAIPAGSAPAAFDAFTGPELDVSKYSRIELARTGTNDGKLGSYYLYAAGTGHEYEAGAFGACSFSGTQDRSTLEFLSWGLGCVGSPRDTPENDELVVDGGPAYAPGSVYGGVAGSGIQGANGFLPLSEPDVRFDAATGDITVDETSSLFRCAPDNSYPPLPLSCTDFAPVGVQVHRTLSIAGDAQLVRTVDRWSSTDGHAHSLALSVDEGSCLSHGNDCSTDLRYRFPGDAAYAAHDAGSAKPGPGPLQAVLVRDGGGAGGGVFVAGQRADGVTFSGKDTFAFDYDRTIPATGTVTLTHYAATVSPADGTPETGLDSLKRLFPAAPKPKPKPKPSPSPSPKPVTPVRPTFSRAGYVRVHRSGRTFAVVTRDRVRCVDACTVTVRGLRVVSKATTVAAGRTAKVSFRLTRSAARTLRHRGALRLTVQLAARSGAGPITTKQRRLTIHA
jgi:hypothetical protein